MAQTVLVRNPDVAAGREMLKALDDSRVKIDVALWALFLREYGDWRLVLSSRQLDAEDPRKLTALCSRLWIGRTLKS